MRKYKIYKWVNKYDGTISIFMKDEYGLSDYYYKALKTDNNTSLYKMFIVSILPTPFKTVIQWISVRRNYNLQTTRHLVKLI